MTKESDDRWKDLEVWQLADHLAYEVYQVTRSFPREELFGLASQLRRAALSVPTNIVEGYSRKGNRELAQFINISLGSLAEVKYLLLFSKRLGYVADQSFATLHHDTELLGRKLWRFYEKVR